MFPTTYIEYIYIYTRYSSNIEKTLKDWIPPSLDTDSTNAVDRVLGRWCSPLLHHCTLWALRTAGGLGNDTKPVNGWRMDGKSRKNREYIFKWSSLAWNRPSPPKKRMQDVLPSPHLVQCRKLIWCCLVPIDLNPLQTHRLCIVWWLVTMSLAAYSESPDFWLL